MGLSIDAAFTGIRGHFALFFIPMLLPIPDARGRPVASGVYLFRLTTPTTTYTNKALLLK